MGHAWMGVLICLVAAGTTASAGKTQSIFFAQERLAKVFRNADKYPWAAKTRDEVITSVAPWLKYSDDELWNLPFGATIQRSHMVWSNGHCPACKQPVTMYSWKHAPHERLWKVWCPHCRAVFPTNDFYRFYQSGLDKHGIFQPEKADRALLFNAEHPDPRDPLHGYGVDDGEGYVDGDKRWRFIGWYLNFAHWSVLIHDGIVNLSAAYALTGDPVYARKAGILLDRLADVWPEFDYREQGFVYEKRKTGGSIRYSIDNCMQVRNLAFAYDQVFDALKGDVNLVSFLAEKAKRHDLRNTKSSFNLIQQNIEQNLFGHALAYPDTIASNYPQPEITRAVIHTILGWPGNREDVQRKLDALIAGATGADGVSGEKGLVGYGGWAVRELGLLIEKFSWIDDRFLAETFKRHPQLNDSWRFHIDTWCFQKYYPLIGDGGAFARRMTDYRGLHFGGKYVKPLDPSMYTFLWKLYQQTGDPAYVQVMVHQNGGKLEGLPHDLFCDDPEALRQEVAAVIAKHGRVIKTGSVNKEDWCLAILRAGAGDTGRALWVSYDAWGAHGKPNGLNIGLFAHGMDFMPQFGYPQVQYGGWASARARWYRGAVAAQNTVCVDGQMQRRGRLKWPSGVSRALGGKTALWADGEVLKAVRVSAPEIIGGQQFERTVGMVALADNRSYIFDIFRVVGGKEHAKFQHTQLGTVTTEGLTLKPAAAWVCDTGAGQDSSSVLKEFQTDTNPAPGWSVEWEINPFYSDSPKDAHFRYIGLTRDAEASLCKGWVLTRGRDTSPDASWLPMLMVRRTAQAAPLASTFVSLLETWRGKPVVKGAIRPEMRDENDQPVSEANVVIQVALAGGGMDMIIARDVEDPLKRNPGADFMHAENLRLKFDGDFGFVRWDGPRTIGSVVLCNAKSLLVQGMQIRMKEVAPHLEIAFTQGQARVLYGKAEAVAEIRLQNKPVHLLR